jgi:hypothetical protein
MNTLLVTIIFSFLANTVVNYGPVEPMDVPSETAAETRCGWFANPTPSNAWLNDAAGEWVISMQSGYQAEGDWPDFKPNQWVKTNVNYGYGCACMRVATDKRQKRILKIFSATARPLSACRRDKALRGAEPR